MSEAKQEDWSEVAPGSMPHVGEWVHVVHCGVVQFQAWRWLGDGWDCSEEGVEEASLLTFSHWMPWPQPPAR